MRILRSSSRRFDRARTHSVREYRSTTPEVAERLEVIRPGRRAEESPSDLLVAGRTGIPGADASGAEGGRKEACACPAGAS